jgi:hypothetical protein
VAPDVDDTIPGAGLAQYTTLLLQPTDNYARITGVVRTYQGATETVTLYEPECTYDPSNNEAILTVLNTYSQDDYNQVLAACLAAEDACTAAGITDLAAPTEEQKASQVYQDYLKAKAALDEADEKMAAAYTGGAVLVLVLMRCGMWSTSPLRMVRWVLPTSCCVAGMLRCPSIPSKWARMPAAWRP